MNNIFSFLKKFKIPYFLLKLSKKIHIRLVVSIVVVFFVLQYTIVDIFFHNIKKESTSETVIQRFSDFFKESRETVGIVVGVAKQFGLDGIRVNDSKKKSSDKVGSIVLKRDDVKIDIKRQIPTCKSRVFANILAKDSKGEAFSNVDVDFLFSNGELPFGLDLGMQKVTSGFRYDAIVFDYMNFFTDKPESENIASLKPQKYSKFSSYEIVIKDIEDGFNVGFFEPKVFYTAKGFGNPIVCYSSIQTSISISNIAGDIVGKFDGVINIGGGDLPLGLENLLLRLSEGDNVSIFLSESWLAIDKKNPPKIKLPHDKYLFFDISIKSVKHPSRMFKADRIGDEVTETIEKKEKTQEIEDVRTLKNILGS